MTPRAPLANRIVATAVSSTSMRSWARQPVQANTSTGSPRNHTNKSTGGMARFMRGPPPAQAPVPGKPLNRLAQEPHQQVDGVDGLVHERTAAVQGPGSPPGSGVVIGLAAPPGDNGAARG